MSRSGLSALFLAFCLIGCAVVPQPAHADTARKIAIRRALLDIYERTNRTRDAMEQYQAIMALAPNDASAHYGLGMLLYRQQEFAVAAPHLKKACSIEGKPEYWTALGDCLMQMRNFTGAIDAYRHGGSMAANKLQSAMQYQQNVKQIENYNRQLKQREEQ